MKKYLIKYSFDEQDQKFVAVCPNLFGFNLYCENIDDMKKQCLHVLRVYTGNNELTGKNIDFSEIENEKELTL